MVTKDELKLMEKFEANAKRWLENEDSVLNKLEKAIEDQDFAVALQNAELLPEGFKGIKEYHRRFIVAIGEIGSRGLGEEYKKELDGLTEEIAEIDTFIEEELGDHSEFMRFIRAREWGQLEPYIERIREAMERLIELDEKLVRVEIKVYDEDKEVAKHFKRIIRKIMKHPEELADPEVLKEVVEVTKDTKKRPSTRARLRLARSTVNVGWKTATWYYVFWAITNVLPTYLEEKTYTITHHDIGIAINDRDFIRTWLSSLTKEQKRKKLDSYLKKHSGIVEEEYQKLLMGAAAEIYVYILEEAHRQYLLVRVEAGKLARELEGKTDIFDLSKIPDFNSPEEIEGDFLASLGKTRAEVITEVFLHLRQPEG